MNKPSICLFGLKIDKDDLPSAKYSLAGSYETDDDIDNIIIKERPDVIVSVGESWRLFPNLEALPMELSKRWLHFSKLDEIQEHTIINCYITSIFRVSDEYPLISFFTTTYKSGTKILRPFRSLLKQTYTNWEW